jgi:hypothetical protein
MNTRHAPFFALLLALALPALADPAPAADKPYPLDTCLVSGETLGGMGEAYVHIHREEGKADREVRLCCQGCLKRFSKEPAKYLARLDAATPRPDAAATPAK